MTEKVYDLPLTQLLKELEAGLTYEDLITMSKEINNTGQARYALNQAKQKGYEIESEVINEKRNKKQFHLAQPLNMQEQEINKKQIIDKIIDEADNMTSKQLQPLIEKHAEEEEITLYDIRSRFEEKTGEKQEETLNPEEIETHDKIDEDDIKLQPTRRPTESKQALTKKANETLIKLEKEILPLKNQLQPVKWEEPPQNQGKDLIIHETDVHFGEVVRDEETGEEIYNSQIAEQRVKNRYNQILAKIREKRENGEQIQTAHLLLGGDLVTNESIYETQPHHIDATIKQQMKQATKVYINAIEALSRHFEHVQIVCIPGNHGEFRYPGRSESANADDLIYDRLEILVKRQQQKNTLENNIHFRRKKNTDHTTFKYRNGKWKGYLTHGQNRSNHIGTSSPQSDWLAMKDRYGFDAAWRGHYHDWKIERVNGSPVCMTPSQKPTAEFEHKNGIFGKPHNVIYLASDERPVETIETFQI